MKTYLFFVVVVVALCRLFIRLRRKPSMAYGSVDAIVPAYNEEICIEQTVTQLLKNPYFNNIIVVDDGSTDGTLKVLLDLALRYSRVRVIGQKNTGKGGALMAGARAASAPYVFLTDADTWVTATNDGIGHLIAELEDGADAVGGIPASNLRGAGILPHVRATVKLPMIALKRTFQQIAGGAPFLISGACGLFKRHVLLEVGFSDRTRVEDLDMTWTLVARGYRVRQSCRCIVYSQECNSLRSEWLRWRRWITGYAVCMRLHKKLLLSRFGFFTILPMVWIVALGVVSYSWVLARSFESGGAWGATKAFFPIAWLAIVSLIACVSAWHHRRLRLVVLAPAAVSYVFLAYAIWLVHGFKGLFTGREPARDKPMRYAHVVG